MIEVKEVVSVKDGSRWIVKSENRFPEHVFRNLSDALYRHYVINGSGITRIVRHRTSTNQRHITVYFSNEWKADFWF